MLRACNKLQRVNAPVAALIVKELEDQRSNLKLIASENFTSLNTQAAMGNLLTDKYAEGFAGSRYYAGCDNIDDIESEACSQACKLFDAEHAYVQPHSGADANLIAFWAILQAKVGTPLIAELGETQSVQHESRGLEQGTSGDGQPAHARLGLLLRRALDAWVSVQYLGPVFRCLQLLG